MKQHFLENGGFGEAGELGTSFARWVQTARVRNYATFRYFQLIFRVLCVFLMCCWGWINMENVYCLLPCISNMTDGIHIQSVQQDGTMSDMYTLNKS